jgi:hypothetical protein
LLLLGALAGACLAHPNLLFSYIAVAWPVALFVLRVATRRAWRRGWHVATVLGWCGLLLVTGVMAVALMVLPVFQATFGYEGWEDPQGIGLALAGGLADATSLLLRGINPLWAVAVVTGAVTVLRSGRRRWLVMSWATVLLLYVLAATRAPGSAWLTGAWYGERQRLGVLITVTGSCLAGVGLIRVVKWWLGSAASVSAGGVVSQLRNRTAAWRAALVAALAACGLLIGVLVLDRPSRIADQGYRLISDQTEPRLVNAQEWTMIQRLAGRLEPDGVVLGNPANGSELLYATIGQPVVFPHLSGVWDDKQLLVAEHLDQVGSDPAVCRALDALSVRYIYADPVVYYDVSDFSALDQAIDRLPEGFVKPLATAGGATIYEIVGCP